MVALMSVSVFLQSVLCCRLAIKGFGRVLLTGTGIWQSRLHVSPSVTCRVGPTFRR